MKSKKPQIENSTLGAGNRDLGVDFIRNYFDLGSYTHRVTSKALLMRFQRVSNIKMKTILIAQMFREYASSFETLGILCRAVRNRFNVEFLTAFISYPPSEAPNFYRTIITEDDAFDASRYLLLPTAEQLRNHGVVEDLMVAYEASVPLLTKGLREVAKLFSAADFATTDIFQRIKHSAVFVDESSIAERYVGNPLGSVGGDDEPGPLWFIPKVKPTAIQCVHASDEFARKLHWNTRGIFSKIQELLAMVFLLHDERVLFVQPRYLSE